MVKLESLLSLWDRVFNPLRKINYGHKFNSSAKLHYSKNSRVTKEDREMALRQMNGYAKIIYFIQKESGKLENVPLGEYKELLFREVESKYQRY